MFVGAMESLCQGLLEIAQDGDSVVRTVLAPGTMSSYFESNMHL